MAIRYRTSIYNQHDQLFAKWVDHIIIVAAISPSHAYCFTGGTCNGMRLEGQEGLTTEMDCCTGGGVSWGGGSQCSTCNDTDWKEMSVNLGPSGQYMSFS